MNREKFLKKRIKIILKFVKIGVLGSVFSGDFAGFWGIRRDFGRSFAQVGEKVAKNCQKVPRKCRKLHESE